MPVLSDVKQNVDTFVQAWVDAIGGFTGIFIAPFKSNTNPAKATKNAAQDAARRTYSSVLDAVVFIPSTAILWWYLEGDNNKSHPRRLGEGVMIGGLIYFVIFMARGWLP